MRARTRPGWRNGCNTNNAEGSYSMWLGYIFGVYSNTSRHSRWHDIEKISLFCMIDIFCTAAVRASGPEHFPFPPIRNRQLYTDKVRIIPVTSVTPHTRGYSPLIPTQRLPRAAPLSPLSVTPSLPTTLHYKSFLFSSHLISSHLISP